MTEELSTIPLYVWVLIAAVLFAQSNWLFNDAAKRGANRWFWGIWGMLHFPTPLLFYMLIVRKVWKRKRKKNN